MTLSLLGVHISQGVLSNPWWIGGYVAMVLLLVVGMRRVSEDEVPRIGVMTAAFFVASSIHIKLPLTSVHLILNGLVGVVLGRRAMLAIVVGLVLQSLLIHHGGIDSLGVNACIIGLPALAAGFLFPRLRRLGVPTFPLGFLLGFGATGASVGLNFVVLFFGGKDDWETLAHLVLLVHVPVALIEGVMLGVVVSYLEKVKPGMLGASRASDGTGS